MPREKQPPHLVKRAKTLRKTMSKPEVYLWVRLRPKVCDLGIRRQVPIADRYVLDFYYPPLKIAFEIDGKIHLDNYEADLSRDTLLSSLGIRTIRVQAQRVLAAPDEVAEYIKAVCRGEIELLG